MDNYFEKEIQSEIDDGCVEYDNGNAMKARVHFEHVLKMYKRHYGKDAQCSEIATVLNFLGACCDELGDVIGAVQYYEKSLAMKKMLWGESGNDLGIAYTLNNLGLCYKHMDNNMEARRHFEQSLAIYKACREKGESDSSVIKVLNNLGNCCYSLGDYEGAIEYFELIVQGACCDQDVDRWDIASAVFDKGRCYEELNDSAMATRCFEDALDLYNDSGKQNIAHPDVARVLRELGWIQFCNKRIEEAIRYAKSSLDMFRVCFGENASSIHIVLLLYDLEMYYLALGDKATSKWYKKQRMKSDRARRRESRKR